MSLIQVQNLPPPRSGGMPWDDWNRSKPTREEKAALDAYAWGFIDRATLDKKIGSASRATQLLANRPVYVAPKPT